MIKFDELYFVASAWNQGNALLIDGYDFLITPIENIGFSQKILIKDGNKKLLVNRLLLDLKSGVVFLKNFNRKKSLINILNFELSLYNQTCVIYQKDYNNSITEIRAEIVKEEDSGKYIIQSDKKILSGAIVFAKKTDFLGIVSYNEEKYELIPAKYLMKSFEEFVKIQKESIRCPICGNIIEKKSVYQESCPKCGAKIDKRLLNDTLPKLDKTDIVIEETLEYLGYNIDLARFGRHFWEIKKGSATIFIRYNPSSKFIVAFSPLVKLNNKNTDIYKFLLEENKKISHIYFSVDKDYVFLNAPYLISNNFNSKILLNVFTLLFKLSDDYDDLLIEKFLKN